MSVGGHALFVLSPIVLPECSASNGPCARAPSSYTRLLTTLWLSFFFVPIFGLVHFHNHADAARQIFSFASRHFQARTHRRVPSSIPTYDASKTARRLHLESAHLAHTHVYERLFALSSLHPIQTHPHLGTQVSQRLRRVRHAEEWSVGCRGDDCQDATGGVGGQ